LKKNMFMKLFRSHLWIQVFVLTWFAMAVVCFIACEWFRLRETDFLRDRLYQQSDATFKAVSAAAVESVISEDIPVLQTIVEQVAGPAEDIARVEVLNEQGVLLARWTRAPDLKKDYENDDSEYFSFSDTIVFEGEVFGEFRLVWDVTHGMNSIEDHVSSGRLFLVGVLGGLTVLITFIIHYIVVRKINKINDRVLEISGGDLEHTVHLHNAAQELENLADSVNKLGAELQVRRSIEQELKEHRDHLEHLVYERTAELQQSLDRLKKSQSMLLQKEKLASLGQLSAGIAHEINNPVGFVSCNLTSLKKYSARISSYVESIDELLNDHVDSELKAQAVALKKESKVSFILDDLVDLVDESQDGVERIIAIVNNLKAFSRVDEAEQKMADINQCIESTIKIVWNELKYDIDLIKDYGDIQRLMCMPQQLNQVFLNLLMNARHAISGKGTITVKTWQADKYVKISFADNGSGIDDEKQNSIFDPFFTTKPVGEGTGLGLSICYDIVSKHGGDISVESEVGTGTEFIISLPLSGEDIIESNNIQTGGSGG